jgi:alpha-1,2-mannosyltransferase
VAPDVAGRAELWWRRLPLERIVTATGVVAVLFQWTTIIVGRHGDFPYHWEWGRRFVAGEFLYAEGMHIPYPPFWAMAHAPLTVFPVRVAQILVFALAVGAIALVLWILDGLTRALWPVDRGGLFWTNAAAIFLASRFLLQDLAHSGSNTLILALVWTGVFFWSARREWAGGLCLGLATALKCTPALFLAYFAWKRQWRMAAAGALTALLLTLAPVLRQGPAEYARHMKFWAGNLWNAVSTADPAMGFLGPEETGNVSVKPAVARLLSRMSGETPTARPFDWKSWLARLSPVILLVAAAWALRGRAERDSARVLFELAAVGVLALLLSPVTWKQHCVGTLPALYLIVRRAISRREASVRGAVLLAAYAFLAICLNRTVAGKALWTWLDSRAILTLCVLGLFFATLACSRESRASETRRSAPRMWTIGLPEPRPPEA